MFKVLILLKRVSKMETLVFVFNRTLFICNDFTEQYGVWFQAISLAINSKSWGVTNRVFSFPESYTLQLCFLSQVAILPFPTSLSFHLFMTKIPSLDYTANFSLAYWSGCTCLFSDHLCADKLSNLFQNMINWIL